MAKRQRVSTHRDNDDQYHDPRNDENENKNGMVSIQASASGAFDFCRNFVRKVAPQLKRTAKRAVLATSGVEGERTPAGAQHPDIPNTQLLTNSHALTVTVLNRSAAVSLHQHPETLSYTPNQHGQLDFTHAESSISAAARLGNDRHWNSSAQQPIQNHQQKFGPISFKAMFDMYGEIKNSSNNPPSPPPVKPSPSKNRSKKRKH